MLANSHLLVKCLPHKAAQAFPSQSCSVLCDGGKDNEFNSVLLCADKTGLPDSATLIFRRLQGPCGCWKIGLTETGPPIPALLLTKVVTDCSSFWVLISLHSLLIKVFVDILNWKRN